MAHFSHGYTIHRSEAMEKWTETHSKLHTVMKREIETMRQLLANLHQEEIFILHQDKTYWNQLMEERGQLIAELSSIRQTRSTTTEILEEMFHFSHSAALEELIPLNDANSADLLFLRDQILTLLDRMNLQTSRNEMLVQLQLHQKQLIPLEKKAKISIATLPPEEYKKGA